MDKISNRLRLVRSQSMGVGMGVANDKISMAAAAARRTVHSSQQNHVHGDVPNNQSINTGVHARILWISIFGQKWHLPMVAA